MWCISLPALTILTVVRPAGIEVEGSLNPYSSVTTVKTLGMGVAAEVASAGLSAGRHARTARSPSGAAGTQRRMGISGAVEVNRDTILARKAPLRQRYSYRRRIAGVCYGRQPNAGAMPMVRTPHAGLLLVWLALSPLGLRAQGWSESPFRPLDLPAPNSLRNGAGRPGPGYWQQEVNYRIDAALDPAANVLRGSARITYRNRSPDSLPY